MQRGTLSHTSISMDYLVLNVILDTEEGGEVSLMTLEAREAEKVYLSLRGRC